MFVGGGFSEVSEIKKMGESEGCVAYFLGL